MPKVPRKRRPIIVREHRVQEDCPLHDFLQNPNHVLTNNNNNIQLPAITASITCQSVSCCSKWPKLPFVSSLTLFTPVTGECLFCLFSLTPPYSPSPSPFLLTAVLASSSSLLSPHLYFHHSFPCNVSLSIHASYFSSL